MRNKVRVKTFFLDPTSLSWAFFIGYKRGPKWVNCFKLEDLDEIILALDGLVYVCPAQQAQVGELSCFTTGLGCVMSPTCQRGTLIKWCNIMYTEPSL